MSATTAEVIEATARALGLRMEAKFVPYSQSRNAGEDSLSLNWRITLLKDGRRILITDYMQGIGWIPGYKAGQRLTVEGAACLKNIAEDGKYNPNQFPSLHLYAKLPEPKLADVLHSLASDSDVLDYASFEEWAPELGYDPDSRKAEATYRICLDIALKLRNALGEDGFRTLREAVRRDY